MRYIIQSNEIGSLIDRKDYIEKVTGLWFFLKSKYEDCVELISLPESNYDVCVIVCHNYKVIEFINRFNIKEKNIVLITCVNSLNKNMFSRRNVRYFIAKQTDDGYALVYNGNDYGFSFDLTESELLLYNLKHDNNLVSNIEKCFERI